MPREILDPPLVVIIDLIYGVLNFAGGLAEEVTEKVLHAAFIPFGDLLDIQIPLDYETGKISRF